jgi:hypothetical protein
MENREKALTHLIKQAQTEYSEENYVFAIPGFMSKKFIAYCAMRDDLTLVLDYIQTLRDIPINRIVKSSLTYSLIALYGKCFTDASKNNYPKLEPNSIFKENEEFKEIHNYLIELRHQFIAHRGKTDSEIGVSFMIFPKEKKEDSQVRFKQLKLGGFGEKRLNDIERIIKFLIFELEKKIQKSGQKLYDGFFNNFDEEQMSFMMINHLKKDKTEEK